MKRFVPLIFTIVLALSCKTQQQLSYHEPDKTESYLRIDKNGCFGKCPIYSVTLFESGLLTYEGVRYVDKMGKFYTVLKGDELAQWEDRIKKAGLMEMADKYPKKYTAPVDLPSINITYSVNGKVKKIVDYGTNDPWALHTLIPALDSLVASKKLHSFDK